MLEALKRCECELRDGTEARLGCEERLLLVSLKDAVRSMVRKKSYMV